MSTLTWVIDWERTNVSYYWNYFVRHYPVIDGVRDDTLENGGLPRDFDFTSMNFAVIHDNGTTRNRSFTMELVYKDGSTTVLGKSNSASARSSTFTYAFTAANLTTINNSIDAGTFSHILVRSTSYIDGWLGDPRVVITSDPDTFTAGTPIEFTTTPATADAIAVDPAVEAIIDPNFTYNAVVATASAASGDPAVTVTASPSFDTTIADATGFAPMPRVSAGRSQFLSSTDVRNTNGTAIPASTFRVSYPYLAKVPRDLINLDPNTERLDSLEVSVLVATAASAGRVFTIEAGTMNANNNFVLMETIYSKFVDTKSLYTYERQTATVPAGATWVRIGQASEVYVLNRPDPTDSTPAYFRANISDAPVYNTNADVMTVNAEMLLAHAFVENNGLALPEPALLSASMPGGYFADASVNADLMTANGLMGAAWFKSARRVYVDAAEATAEALEIESVVTYRNVIVEAGVAEMSDGWISDPLEVNNDINDPYWNRVIRKSTDGHLPPAAVNWFRFDERSGADVFMSDPLTGLKTTTGGELVGAFTRSRPGPNGKRAVKVDNAGLNVQRDDTWSAYIGHSYITDGASLEFTVKVDPGHTGRMDIANGIMKPWVQPGTLANTHVSIRDGKLFALTGPSGPNRALQNIDGIKGKGGTSMRRIDDGKWHHIVITPRPGDYWQYDSGENIPLDFYIDGVRDRSFMTIENKSTTYQAGDPRFFARPDYYFGQDTGYPFKGEILDVIYRQSSMNSSQVMDLYLDMFGFKATRAGIVGAAVGAMGDAKVESNMKRMLVLSFGNVPAPGLRQQTDNNAFGVLVNKDNPQRQTDMMLYSKDGKYGIGNYLMTYQQVEYGRPGDAAWEYRRDKGEPEYEGAFYQFRDEATGLMRFIDIHRDIDLDDFDVIYVQGYTNPSLNTQAEVALYEPFFNSLNKALVDGKKLWITDPYLAADLGWVTDVDVVPVLRRNGNDVRGHDVAPFPELTGIAKQPIDRPADDSMPVLPTGLPQGSNWGRYNLWRWDFHNNNGYRVVNEIDGLTDLPSWEVDELFVRDRTQMLPNGSEWETKGYRLVNRTGDDYEWERDRSDAPDGTWEMVKPSTGTGLKAGDEFYDYTWYENGWDWFKYASSANSSYADRALLNRAAETYAIPMGHLRVGVPVTTFRSTVHDDFGNEVANPYRNHIRNAVVRPGDRLPDGRKVMGYAVMEFAQRPDHWFLTGQGIVKQLTFPAGVPADLNPNILTTPVLADMETDRSFPWDYTEFGRMTYSGGGEVTMTRWTLYYRRSQSEDRSGKPVTDTAPTFKGETITLPIAEKRSNFHPTTVLPHQNWISRGLSWLFTLDRVETEYSNVAVQAATASGSMRSPQIDTEFDRVVTVGAAQATGTIVAPEEAQVKDVKVMAFAATASAKMNGLVGGYKAEAAQGFGSMPQNVTRPLDTEEVLFFTVTMNQKTINLRMEEN